jgi:hypothetical protein
MAINYPQKNCIFEFQWRYMTIMKPSTVLKKAWHFVAGHLLPKWIVEAVIKIPCIDHLGTKITPMLVSIPRSIKQRSLIEWVSFRKLQLDATCERLTQRPWQESLWVFLQTWPEFIAKHGEVKHNGVCIETAKKIGVLQPLVTRTSCNENCLIFWEKNTQRKGQDTQGFPPTGAFRRLMALFCKGPVWIKPGTGSGCRGSLY